MIVTILALGSLWILAASATAQGPPDQGHQLVVGSPDVPPAGMVAAPVGATIEPCWLVEPTMIVGVGLPNVIDTSAPPWTARAGPNGTTQAPWTSIWTRRSAPERDWWHGTVGKRWRGL